MEGNLTIVENRRLRFILHNIAHLLNWIEINLFANMGLDTSSCTDSVWILMVFILFGFISLNQNYGQFLVGGVLCLY